MKKRRKLSGWNANYGVNPKKRYLEYRHGKAKPVSLAPIFKKREREAFVDDAMIVMRDWDLTPFQNEGPVRAGIRASLCTRGHDWARCDMEAEMITQACLHRMGAQRPSWEAGQREYTIAVENCAWCGGPRDPSMRGRFCSVECGRVFVADRKGNEIRRNTAIYRSAARVLRQDKKDRRSCLNCGGAFMHDGDRDPRKFCCGECYHHFQRSDATARFLCTCKLCGAGFHAKSPERMYCSNACQITESRLRLGKNPPKNLTRSVFDYHFTRPINERAA